MFEPWMVAAGAVALALLVAMLLAAAQENRRHARQHRLDQAYARARRVRYAGTGEQGRPYSVYTDRVNQF